MPPEVFSKLFEAKLITVFKLAVVWRLFLDCVVGKMDQIVSKSSFVRGVNTWACTNIPFWEEIAVHIMVNENPDADIKLSTINK